MNRLLTIGLFCLVLAACFGGSKPAVRSEVQQRGETSLARGVRAEQKGNHQEALGHLNDALTAATSIEDNSLRSLALINLARVHRLQQDFPRSEQYGQLALSQTAAGTPLYSEAAHEKALLLLTQDQLPQSLEWALTALENEQGEQRGSRRNLVARIRLELGQRDEANNQAHQALQENRAAEQREEQANSLRTLGIIARLNNRLADAERHLLEGLSIDKQLGKSAKIAADLEELASVCRADGRRKEALDYLQRAGEVHRAAGRTAAYTRITELRAALHESAGETGTARTIRESLPVHAQNSSATIKPSRRP